MGGEDSPSFRKISSLIVFLVISLKMFLSVQTGQPGLDFFAMFIPDTKIVLEACKTFPIIRCIPRPVNLPSWRGLCSWEATYWSLSCLNISVNAEERLRVYEFQPAVQCELSGLSAASLDFIGVEGWENPAPSPATTHQPIRATSRHSNQPISVRTPPTTQIWCPYM